jgi:DNA-binding transcriptional MerR regulator
MDKALPQIPAKRYFTIGEVSELCGVKPYVLRYWEQEFSQLKPMKRRGNRRYYQHHEVLLVRRIRELLYEQGFTISGARNRLVDGEGETPATDTPRPHAQATLPAEAQLPDEPTGTIPSADESIQATASDPSGAAAVRWGRRATDLPPSEVLKVAAAGAVLSSPATPRQVRDELVSIRGLLTL